MVSLIANQLRQKTIIVHVLSRYPLNREGESEWSTSEIEVVKIF